MSKNKMKKDIIKYLAKIGRKGGQKSRRCLTPEQAREMVKAREKKLRPKVAIPSNGTCQGE